MVPVPQLNLPWNTFQHSQVSVGKLLLSWGQALSCQHHSAHCAQFEQFQTSVPIGEMRRGPSLGATSSNALLVLVPFVASSKAKSY